MKTTIITVIICMCAFAKANSQQLSGVATYQSQRSIDLKLDENKAKNVSSEMQKEIEEQLRKQFQKEYILTFKGKESSYRQEESLAVPTPSANGIRITVTGDKGVTYRNLAENLLLKESEIMGKLFLIKDSPKKPEWVLEKEVKNIGVYTCFKATTSEEYEQPSFNEETGEEEESVTKTRTITAWYTLDIPVNHGPDEYWGLPGLILEVSDGKFSLMCTKVVLNPKKGVQIVLPEKGKEVTKDEFNKIQEEKMDEMMERQGGKRGKNGSRVFTTTEIIRN
ncbi:GLPGLI family protein [Dokdonia sp. Hel_I_63]|uniref:GLPGLI family protein n=1 Tax=Dokdonia sp. Hel_I_63 TaxID=1249996 RepID=UPI00119C360B|nr:GLPGLI family protein [Dokdonia sp. Hel_I_63]TVZ22029.1 GLPGLI family protein [Dokdonia sp. Hel_I_63]